MLQQIYTFPAASLTPNDLRWLPLICSEMQWWAFLWGLGSRCARWYPNMWGWTECYQSMIPQSRISACVVDVLTKPHNAMPDSSRTAIFIESIIGRVTWVEETLMEEHLLFGLLECLPNCGFTLLCSWLSDTPELHLNAHEHDHLGWHNISLLNRWATYITQDHISTSKHGLSRHWQGGIGEQKTIWN